MSGLRALRVCALLLGALVLLGAAAVFWLGFTAAGARTLVSFATQAVDLRYATLSGTLAQGLDLTRLVFRTPGFTLKLAAASFRWRPQALLQGTVAIDRLTLAEGELALQPGDEAGSGEWPQLPVTVDIEELEVRSLSVVSGDTRQRIARFTASVHAAQDRISVRRYALELDGHRAHGKASVADGGEFFDVTIDYAGSVVLDGAVQPLAATLTLLGPRERLALALRMSAPFPLRLEGFVDVAAPAPRVSLRGDAAPNAWLAARELALDVDDLRFSLEGELDALVLGLDARLRLPAQPALAVTIELAREPPRAPEALRARLDWQLQAAAPLLGHERFAGGGELEWHAGRLTLAQTLTQPALISLTAAFDTGDSPHLEMRGDWTALALDVGATRLRSPRGAIDIVGVYPDLSLRFDGQFEEARLGAVDMRLAGTLAQDAFTLDALRARLLGGELEARGALDYVARRGAFDVTLDGLDLSSLREGLATTLAAQARVTLDGSRVDVALAEASGRWRQHTLAARGDVSVDAATEALSLNDLRLRIGRNRLVLNGTADERFALDFELAAPAIAEIDAALAGAIDGKGSLRGTREAPLLAADLNATALAAGSLRVARATLDASLSPAAPSRLKFDAYNVQAGDTALGEVSLIVSGTLAAHTLALTAGEGARQLELRSQGRYADGRLDGRLGELAVTWPETGRWALADEARWQYAAAGVSFSPLCLVQDAARVCIDAQQLAADAGELHAALTRVPLALASPWLPPTLVVDGVLAGDLFVSHAQGRWQPRGRVGAQDVRLTLHDTDEPQVFRIAPLALEFDATPGGQAFTFEAISDEFGALHADGSVRDEEGGAHIDARLRADAIDLGTLGRFVPAIVGSKGRIELTATVRGPLDAPQVQASGGLKSGELRLETLGIALDHLRLEAGLREAGRIDAELSLGQALQRLTLRGHVQRAPDWPYSFEVESERFPLLRRVDLDLDIAPDLTIDGTLDDLRLRGKLDLPLLHVRLQQLPPDAVTVSADEVLIDDNGEVIVDDEASPSGLAFYRDHVTGELRVKVGEDARVTGLGLEAGLAGAITFNKDVGSLGFAEGRIALQDGRYEAYRQTLTVKTGELFFAGPIDNPRLDVLAVRPDLDVTAGVQVSGTVQSPIVRLYSSPAMADLETLSYVVTGKPLAGTNRSAAGMLSKAALGLGLEQATGLTEQLRSWFGLDQLGISGGDTVEDTSFVAGKQLSPRIKVRSEFNPFDRLWSVFLNYALTEHWSVEGESGARQGADLLYSIERDTLF